MQVECASLGKEYKVISSLQGSSVNNFTLGNRKSTEKIISFKTIKIQNFMLMDRHCPC